MPFLLLGVCLTLGAGSLAARLFWEETFLTWARGPQMIGFSLIHGPGVVLLLFPFCLLGWSVIAVVVVVYMRAKLRTVGRTSWYVLLMAIASLAVLSIPPSWLDRIFVDKLAYGSHAPDFLITSAAEGHKSVVDALLARGVSVNAHDRDGITPLLAATNGDQPAVILDLLERGADVNATNSMGKSAVALAMDAKRPHLVNMLSVHGGREIRPAKIELPADITVTAKP